MEEDTKLNGSELATSDAMSAQYGVGLSIAQIKWAGQVFHKSGLFNDTQDEAAAMVKIMAGQEIGMAPFAAMNGINIIKGRISMSGNMIAAAIKRHPLYRYTVDESSANTCRITWHEKIDGKWQKAGTNEFSIEMARAAKLHGDNWDKYPQAMLFNRAISAGQRMFAPDVFTTAVYTPDEAIEIKNGDGDGYIPVPNNEATVPQHTPPKRRVVNSDAEEAEIVQDGQEDAAVGSDEPFTEQPPTADATDVDEPPINDEEDEAQQPKAIKREKVDKAFKDRVKKTLEALKMLPQDRLRLLKDATGKITMEGLTDEQWILFRDAIDTEVIEAADKLTEAETPVQTNTGEGEEDANTDGNEAENTTETAQ